MQRAKDLVTKPDAIVWLGLAQKERERIEKKAGIDDYVRRLALNSLDSLICALENVAEAEAEESEVLGARAF